MSPPHFFQTLYQPNLDRTWQMYVHAERHELTSLPESDEELASWLEARWMEKGDKLEVLRQKLVEGVSWQDHEKLKNGHVTNGR